MDKRVRTFVQENIEYLYEVRWSGEELLRPEAVEKKLEELYKELDEVTSERDRLRRTLVRMSYGLPEED